MKKRKAGDNVIAKSGTRPILPAVMEAAFVSYITYRAKICYGMTATEVRVAAYKFAIENDVRVPKSWTENQRAGMEWYWQFRQRNSQLSLRKPEACSLARATSFNAHNVNMFFDNLEIVYRKLPTITEGTRIYNLDETALLTVQVPEKILADKRTRKLNKVTSAERGTLITACCIIAANGTYVPPALVYPRKKKVKDHTLRGAPIGTLSLSHQSGWMTGESFLEVMKHFVKHTNSSNENPSVLILDNHESHLTPAVVNFAKDNGVIIVTLPPHCSNKLQPLDVSVYRSLKIFYYRAIDGWMLAHPGVPLTIHDVAPLFNEAFLQAFTPHNITKGFSSCGIFPFNRNIFQEEDFLCSTVTDRPLPDTLSTVVSASPLESTHTTASTPSAPYKSPEDVFGIPKAEPRKLTHSSRSRKSCIATSTPEKLAIEERSRQQELKRVKTMKHHALKTEQKKGRQRLEKREGEQLVDAPSRKRGRPRKRLDYETSDPDDPQPLTSLAALPSGNKRDRKPIHHLSLPNDEGSSSSEDDIQFYSGLHDHSKDEETFSDLETIQVDLNLTVNDYCAVKFYMDEKQCQVKHFIGKVEEIDAAANAFKINFLRKFRPNTENRFIYPNVKDVAWVKKEFIVTKLVALTLGTTSRQQSYLSFSNFDKFSELFINLY